MTLDDFLAIMNSGKTVIGGSDAHLFMIQLADEAMRITAEINGRYHTQPELRVLMSELTGKPLDISFTLFPPFTTDCGKNTTFGKHVFVNAGCRFQDQGGITIGDACQIGHNVVMATLNHSLQPAERANITPAPIVLERNVWVGANATILPGVTIGENAVVAAGAVVTKNVPANTVVGGVPARVLRTIE